MNQPLLITMFGVAAVATAIGVNVYIWQDELAWKSGKPTVVEQTSLSDKATPAVAQPTQPPSTPPSFDVVRVTPEGDAVIAGRADPGSTVAIIDNGQFVGQLNADERGEWVFIPPEPLAPGSRQLGLEMRDGKGGAVTASDDVVVVVVPERHKDFAGRPSKKPSQPLALKFPRSGDGPSTVLQMPTPGDAAGALAVDTIDYDEQGRLNLSGRGEAGARVRIYMDNKIIGEAEIDVNGGWRMRPTERVAAGLYTLRADQVDAGGKVAARISLPFARAEPPGDLPPEPFVIVQPGNSLWRMARRTYGSGFNFTTIYAANKDQIKDPDLIFPGQVLALPTTN